MKFERHQSTVTINGIDIGGQPGEYPTALIGTIFYERHKIVDDEGRGLFDKSRAEELINRQAELSEKTGNPHMVDIVASSTEAIEKYISFVTDVTDAPIMVDSSIQDVRTAGIRYASEVGLLEKTIYNSISSHVKKEELETLRELNVRSALVLAYNPTNVLPQGRISLLLGDEKREGLLKATKEAGIENILIDVAVLDVPSIGLAMEAVPLVKEALGLPTGAAPLNAVLEWKRAKELGEYAKKVCQAASASIMQCAGADFVLYGPIEKAGLVFPAVAMSDSIISLGSQWPHGPKTKGHPLYKIF